MDVLFFWFVGTWVCGALVFWFFSWMTKPWQFVPRLLLLTLIAATFAAPSLLVAEGGAAPVPAIFFLLFDSWQERLLGSSPSGQREVWGVIPIAAVWLGFLLISATVLFFRQLIRRLHDRHGV